MHNIITLFLAVKLFITEETEKNYENGKNMSTWRGELGEDGERQDLNVI